LIPAFALARGKLIARCVFRFKILICVFIFKIKEYPLALALDLLAIQNITTVKKATMNRHSRCCHAPLLFPSLCNNCINGEYLTPQKNSQEGKAIFSTERASAHLASWTAEGRNKRNYRRTLSQHRCVSCAVPPASSTPSLFSLVNHVLLSQHCIHVSPCRRRQAGGHLGRVFSWHGRQQVTAAFGHQQKLEVGRAWSKSSSKEIGGRMSREQNAESKGTSLCRKPERE